MDEAIEYRGFKITARVKRLLNGRFRAEHIVTPMNDRAMRATGGVPRLCSAAEVKADRGDPEAAALRTTLEASKAFVDVLYETER
ncbi:hypothetical protein [Dongia sedimenti]|uniref:Uncharacterized protein n=1 Tax=Dongia sedimenti TaxID=3064282 RepID=A0ABU0YRU3_9PROT|nr:hypothetical protein [Rhodospirillaceae bacterium R-7]